MNPNIKHIAVTVTTMVTMALLVILCAVSYFHPVLR